MSLGPPHPAYDSDPILLALDNALLHFPCPPRCMCNGCSSRCPPDSASFIRVAHLCWLSVGCDHCATKRQHTAYASLQSLAHSFTVDGGVLTGYPAPEYVRTTTCAGPAWVQSSTVPAPPLSINPWGTTSVYPLSCYCSSNTSNLIVTRYACQVPEIKYYCGATPVATCVSLFQSLRVIAAGSTGADSAHSAAIRLPRHRSVSDNAAAV